MANTQELAGKSRLFKTISIVVYVFLYLTYTMQLAIMFHTIDSQYTNMTIQISYKKHTKMFLNYITPLKACIYVRHTITVGIVVTGHMETILPVGK